jgi:hypothetical protein
MQIIFLGKINSNEGNYLVDGILYLDEGNDLIAGKIN